MDRILGYEFKPVSKENFKGMQPASSTSCPVSRRLIYGCGGRRDVFHPDVITLLKIDRVIQELIRDRLIEFEKDAEL